MHSNTQLSQPTPGQTTRAVFPVLCLLSVFSLITGNLGHLSQQLNQLLAVSLLAVVVAIHIPPASLIYKVPTKKLAVPAGLIAAAILVWVVGGEIERCVAVLLVYLVLEHLARAVGRVPDGASSVGVLAAYLIALYVIIYKHIPPMWYAIERSSQLLSESVSHLAGKELSLRATASGIHILAFFLLYVLGFYLLYKPRTWRNPTAVVCLAVGINIAYLLTADWAFVPLLKLFQNPYHQGHSHYHAYTITSLNTSFVLMVLLAIPAFYIGRTITGRRPSVNEGLAGRLKLATGMVFLGVLALSYLPLGSQTKRGTVFLYDRGYLNWNRPIFGQYGERSTGMFGMLPVFLEASGSAVKGESEISDRTLDGCSTLVVINLQHSFDPEEFETIWRFVQNGGALLALGDHTGLAGIRDPFNDLLQPVGIKFNFDCAHYIKDWDSAFELFPHPVTLGLNAGQELGISIGASLDIPPNATPIVTAKYGYSDRGNANNASNAYLGDRQYNPGEPLGDIVTVAAARYGKGKVLVFGDTSTFQNASLVRAHQFAQQVFTWLGARGPRAVFSNLLLVAGLALILLPLLLINTGSILPAVRLFGLAVLFGLIAATMINAFAHREAPFEGNIALIDTSHAERLSLKYESDESFLGLSFNLMRNGYLPLEMDRFDQSQLRTSTLLAAVAPTKRFSSSEIREIKEFMASGGTFVVCSGWEEAYGSIDFLQDFQLAIENVPLGPVDAQSNTAGAQFYNAWPLRVDSPDTEIISALREPRLPLMVNRPYGTGRFVLIGDPAFLSNANLESFREYTVENIDFLKGLLQAPSGAANTAPTTAGAKKE
jgi:Domain of unknown function (DUF4350)